MPAEGRQRGRLEGEQIFVICPDREVLRGPDYRGLARMYEGADLITSRTTQGRRLTALRSFSDAASATTRATWSCP